MNDSSAALFLENQLCFPLYAASRLTTKVYAPFLEKMDITYPQYLVLLLLWQHSKMSVKAMGQKLYLESNTLTPLLKRMEQKELIYRERSKQDERTVFASLTPKGEDLKKEALSIPQKIVASFQHESITEPELRNFQQTLLKLLSILGGEKPQSNQCQ